MSERRLWIGLVGGGVLAGAAFGGLIYMKHQDIERAREEVAGLRASIESARKTIEGTAALEREVIVLREMSEVIGTILPTSEEVNNLIHTLHAYSGQAGVRTTSYKRKPDHARGTRKADFDKVAYTLTLEGDTFQFLDMLNRVETHSRFIAVPAFKLTAASRKSVEDDGIARHKIQIDLETYMFEPPNKIKQASIEGFERKRDLLLGEINRRKQALMLASYNYRGPRGRRDPWVDPRVPASVEEESALSVQEQMDLVEEMRQRMDEAHSQWDAVENAENVLAAMIARRDLEEVLALLEEDLRRLENDGLITYVPAQKRLKNDVYDPLDALRRQVAESQGLLGPSKEMLVQVADAMERHIDEGEFELALDTFETIQNSLDLVKGDPVRAQLADRVRQLAEDGQTLLDFQAIQLVIGGVAIIEGMPPAIIINGRSLTIGDLVGNELEIVDIRPGEIDFYFRGLILTKVF